MDPCGTPQWTGSFSDSVPSSVTLWERFLTLIRAASGQIDLWLFHSKIILDYFIKIDPFFMTFPKMWFYIGSWKNIFKRWYFSPSNDNFKNVGVWKKLKFVTISVVIKEKVAFNNCSQYVVFGQNDFPKYFL